MTYKYLNEKYPTYWHNNSYMQNMKLIGTTMNLGQLGDDFKYCRT